MDDSDKKTFNSNGGNVLKSKTPINYPSEYLNHQVKKSNEQAAENNNPPTEDHLNVLTIKFGHREFRPLQWDILTALMEQQRDVIAVMATGYGKSLCYQFPSVYSGGVTIVISPLISRMQHQVANLQLSNIAACFLSTTQTEKKKVVEDVLRNKYRITYLTPEFCTGDFGVQFLIKISLKLSVDLIAIDEAHCISSWGHDFRPKFKKLGVLRLCFPNVPILALTATATPKIVPEITKCLKLKNPFTLYSGFDRPNLFLGVQRKTKKIMEDLHKVMIMENGQLQFSGPTIIYCITHQQTEYVNAILAENKHRSVLYHSNLTMERRKFNYEKFLNNEVGILVATIAPDLAIDKPNVRNVIHYGCSGSLEGYYQEIGRAGHDGLPARCTTFHNDLDFGLHSLNWDSNLERKQVKLNLLCDFLKIDSCRREHILEYFKDAKGTQVSNTIKCCDNCVKRLSSNASDSEVVKYDGLYDFSEDAKILLNSIEQMGTYNSITIALDFLFGIINNKTERHQNKSYFGAGRGQTKTWWKAVINLFIRNRYISEQNQKTARSSTFKSLRVSERGRNFLKTARVLYLKPSNEFLELLKRKPYRREWIVNKGREQAAVKKNEPSTSSDFDANVLELNEVLLGTRKYAAQILKCRSYSIATNAAIMELARKMPITIKELEDADIAGLNKVKFPKFAYYFVQAIRGFCFNEYPSLRDVLLGDPRVVQGDKLSASMEFTYNLYKNKCSVTDIAAHRNLTEATVEEQLINCLKLGYDIHLSVFGIDQKIFHKIKDVFDTYCGYGRKEMPATIANLLSEFTYLQTLAVFWYIKIRKRLQRLHIVYEEFDEFDCSSAEDFIFEMVDQDCESELSDSSSDDDKENEESSSEDSSDESNDDEPSPKIRKVDYLKEQNPAAENVEENGGVLLKNDKRDLRKKQPKNKLPQWLKKKSRK